MTEAMRDNSHETNVAPVHTSAVAGARTISAYEHGMVAAGDTVMSPRSLLGELTAPETRILEPGEPFRFLTHAVVNGAPEAKYAHMSEAADEVAENTDRAVGYSLLDQDHTTTFEGYNGFIVEPPTGSEEIYATHATDVAVDAPVRQTALLDGDTLLSRTDPLEYNHLTMQPRRPTGVFIRYSTEDRTELGSVALNDQLKQVAQEHGLPVVHIPVERHPITPGEPTVEVTPGHDATSRNHVVRIPRDGLLYHIQVIESADTAAISFLEDGFAARWRRIDEYGMAETPQDPAELAEISTELTKLIESGNDSPALQYALRKLGETQPAA